MWWLLVIVILIQSVSLTTDATSPVTADGTPLKHDTGQLMIRVSYFYSTNHCSTFMLSGIR